VIPATSGHENTKKNLVATLLPQPQLPLPQWVKGKLALQKGRILQATHTAIPYPAVYLPALRTLLQ
jgi:hypothetical protein